GDATRSARTLGRRCHAMVEVRETWSAPGREAGLRPHLDAQAGTPHERLLGYRERSLADRWLTRADRQERRSLPGDGLDGERLAQEASTGARRQERERDGRWRVSPFAREGHLHFGAIA